MTFTADLPSDIFMEVMNYLMPQDMRLFESSSKNLHLTTMIKCGNFVLDNNSLNLKYFDGSKEKKTFLFDQWILSHNFKVKHIKYQRLESCRHGKYFRDFLNLLFHSRCFVVSFKCVNFESDITHNFLSDITETSNLTERVLREGDVKCFQLLTHLELGHYDLPLLVFQKCRNLTHLHLHDCHDMNISQLQVVEILSQNVQLENFLISTSSKTYDARNFVFNDQIVDLLINKCVNVKKIILRLSRQYHYEIHAIQRLIQDHSSATLYFTLDPIAGSHFGDTPLLRYSKLPGTSKIISVCVFNCDDGLFTHYDWSFCLDIAGVGNEFTEIRCTCGDIDIELNMTEVEYERLFSIVRRSTALVSLKINDILLNSKHRIAELFSSCKSLKIVDSADYTWTIEDGFGLLCVEHDYSW